MAPINVDQVYLDGYFIPTDTHGYLGTVPYWTWNVLRGVTDIFRHNFTKWYCFVMNMFVFSTQPVINALVLQCGTIVRAWCMDWNNKMNVEPNNFCILNLPKLARALALGRFGGVYYSFRMVLEYKLYFENYRITDPLFGREVFFCRDSKWSWWKFRYVVCEPTMTSFEVYSPPEIKMIFDYMEVLWRTEDYLKQYYWGYVTAYQATFRSLMGILHDDHPVEAVSPVSAQELGWMKYVMIFPGEEPVFYYRNNLFPGYYTFKEPTGWDIGMETQGAIMDNFIGFEEDPSRRPGAPRLPQIISFTNTADPSASGDYYDDMVTPCACDTCPLKQLVDIYENVPEPTKQPIWLRLPNNLVNFELTTQHKGEYFSRFALMNSAAINPTIYSNTFSATMTVHPINPETNI